MFSGIFNTIFGTSVYEVVPNLDNVSFNHLLSNNLFVILLLLSGSLFFGSTTLLELCLNGLYFGFYLSLLDIQNIDAVILILPHGILEIPAIIIAGAAGFKIPYEIVRYLLGKKEVILTKEDIKEYLTLALISIVLIVIAAWVEANVTLKIAKMMLNSTKGI